MKKQNLFQSPKVGDLVDLCKNGEFYRTVPILRINGKKQIQVEIFGYFWNTDGRSVSYDSKMSIKPHQPQEPQTENSQPQNTLF